MAQEVPLASACHKNLILNSSIDIVIKQAANLIEE